MAPPSRSSLNIKAAKKLEEFAEDLLSLTPSTERTLLASKVNGIFSFLPNIISTLSTVKDLCDSGANSYPNYPRVREAMLEAGNTVYRAKVEISDLHQQFLITPLTEVEAYRGFGERFADIASRLRGVVFVAKPKKKKEEEAPSA